LYIKNIQIKAFCCSLYFVSPRQSDCWICAYHWNVSFLSMF